MVTAYYVVKCLNIKMNILTHDDKMYIYNLGEFIIGGATCPPSWIYSYHFSTQNKYFQRVPAIILLRLSQHIRITTSFANLTSYVLNSFIGIISIAKTFFPVMTICIMMWFHFDLYMSLSF